MNWNDYPGGTGILWIPESTENLVNTEYENLLTSHGTITIDMIHAWEDYLEEASDYRRKKISCCSIVS
jgi:hypothetical protein